MIANKQLGVQKTLISFCQHYYMAIDEMLADPGQCGIDIGTEDEVLKQVRNEFQKIEEMLKLRPADEAATIVDRFLENWKTLQAFTSLRKPEIAYMNLSTEKDLSSYYVDTYRAYVLNQIQYFLKKVAADPDTYLIKVKSFLTMDDVNDLLREVNLLISMQDKGIFTEEMLTARTMELAYIFVNEVVCLIDCQFTHLMNDTNQA